MIAENPIGAGHFATTFNFKAPTVFALNSNTFTATSLFVEITLSGGWFEQLGSIDGTAGLYDVLRRRAKVGTGPYRLHFKGMDLTKGTPVNHPPRQELDISMETAPDEMWMQLLYLIDCNCRSPVPALEELIVPRDLDLVVTGLPPELQPAAPETTLQRKTQSFFVAQNPRVGPDHSFTFTAPGNAE